MPSCSIELGSNVNSLVIHVAYTVFPLVSPQFYPSVYRALRQQAGQAFAIPGQPQTAYVMPGVVGVPTAAQQTNNG